jgi:hypothetical protein
MLFIMYIGFQETFGCLQYYLDEFLNVSQCIPNILSSTCTLFNENILNIRHRLYTHHNISSRTFGYHLPFFPNTLITVVHISEYFYCKGSHTGMHSGIHPLWSLYSHLLKFSLDFRSIIKYTTPLSPFYEFNGTYLFLIYSFLFSFFIFISFCSSFTFSLFILCFKFWTFVLYSYLSDFLFPIFF